MSFEMIGKAFLLTYLISTLCFMVLSYLGAGTNANRMIMILLWPLYIFLIGLYFILDTFIAGIEFLLESIWGDEFVDQADDEGEE